MRTDTTPYLVARARLQLHHSKNAASLMKELDSKRTSPSGESESIDNYLRAITHIALQQPKEAEQLLQQLVTHFPESIAYRETLGQLYRTQGKYPQAVSLYRDGLKRYPKNELLSLSLSENLLAQKKYTQAREQIQDVLRLNPSSTPALRLLAQLEAESGNPAASHLAQAEYYRLLEDHHSALEQLKLAKRTKGLDFYHASRIEALNREIKQELEKTKKHSLK
jgi:predicted Zn-dependent protease